MRLNNKGITLVELIIAIAISTIIFGAAMIFMTSAHRGYRTASTENNLQTEAQIQMEQISEWVMESNKVETDATKIVLYRDIYEEKDPSVGPELVETKRVIWLGSSGKLYMKKFKVPTADVTIADEVIENCIGEYVVAFTPVYDASVNKNKVSIQLKLTIGTKEYVLNNTIKVRNAVVEGIRCLDWRRAA